MVNYLVGIVLISLVSSGYGLQCASYGVDIKDKSDEVTNFKKPTNISTIKCFSEDPICVTANISTPDGTLIYPTAFCANKDFDYTSIAETTWEGKDKIYAPRASDITTCTEELCNDPATQCFEYGVETDAKTGKPTKIKKDLASMNRLCPAAKCVSGWVRYDNDEWQRVGYCAQLDSEGKETFTKDDLKQLSSEISGRTVKDAHVEAACTEKTCNPLATDIECLQYGATLTESGVISENNDINKETSEACPPWSPTCVKGTLSYKKNESTIPIEVCSTQSNCVDFGKTIKEKNADIKDLTACDTCTENCNQSTSTTTTDGGDRSSTEGSDVETTTSKDGSSTEGSGGDGFNFNFSFSFLFPNLPRHN